MKRGIITCLAAIAVLAVDGCKKPNAAAPDAANKAFQSAAPELKDAWASAVAADKTNGYADAYLTLLQMRHQTDLPPDQLAAIDALANSVHTRMSEAAQKGDPAAQKAIQEIGQMRRRGNQ